MITNRRTFLGLAAAAVTIPLAGCAPGGSAPAASSAPTDVNTDPASLPETTITTLDTWTDKASMRASSGITSKPPKSRATISRSASKSARVVAPSRRSRGSCARSTSRRR
jgi:hypothetical protein